MEHKINWDTDDARRIVACNTSEMHFDSVQFSEIKTKHIICAQQTAYNVSRFHFQRCWLVSYDAPNAWTLLLTHVARKIDTKNKREWECTKSKRSNWEKDRHSLLMSSQIELHVAVQHISFHISQFISHINKPLLKLFVSLPSSHPELMLSGSPSARSFNRMLALEAHNACVCTLFGNFLQSIRFHFHLCSHSSWMFCVALIVPHPSTSDPLIYCLVIVIIVTATDLYSVLLECSIVFMCCWFHWFVLLLCNVYLVMELSFYLFVYTVLCAFLK